MRLRLQVAVPPASQFVADFPGPSIRIGRDPAGEIILDGPELQKVSWNHSRIELQSGSATLYDLGSTNKTYHDGNPVNEPTKIAVGSDIRLGQTGPQIRVLELDLSSPPLLTPTSLNTDDTRPTHLLPSRREWILAAVAITLALLFALNWLTHSTSWGSSRTPPTENPTKGMRAFD